MSEGQGTLWTKVRSRRRSGAQIDASSLKKFCLSRIFTPLSEFLPNPFCVPPNLSFILKNICWLLLMCKALLDPRDISVELSSEGIGKLTVTELKLW